MKQNKIFAIGIQDYDDPNLNNLSNCKSDIDAIINILINKYEFDEVKFLFTKEQTTRKSIYNELKFYFKDCLENENVLLIFAGHGEYDKDFQSCYWQTSDSDSTDSSTWFDIRDLLSFIKISKAHHVTIISDSCFSGGLFNAPTRGGGINAIDNKKSRYALTSGSLEKVSDGNKGGLSPFAKALCDELENNTIKECPIALISTNLVLNFDKNKTQTPMFGALIDVGHEGGCFILKQKEIEDKENKDNIKSIFQNLYIPLEKDHLKIITKIKGIIEDKIKAIKAQDYLEARKNKDEEENIKERLLENFSLKLREKFKDIEIPYDIKKEVLEYDNIYKVSKLELPKKEEKLKEYYSEFKKSFPVKESKFENVSVEIIEYLPIDFPHLSIDNRFTNYFENKKNIFFDKLQENVLDLYKEFLIYKAGVNNDYLNEKEKKIILILQKIYEAQMDILLSKSYDKFSINLKLKKIELEILKWIENR